MANKGSFKKGRRHPKQGGKRAGAGRKSKKQKELEAWTEKRVREHVWKNAKGIVDRWIKLAKGSKSAATTRHAMDKLLPPVEKVHHTGDVIFRTNLPEEED